MPHEMIHDELQAPGEQVQQGPGTIRTVEDVFFLDADHRQFAPHGINPVTDAGEFLLSLKQIEPGVEPFLARNDLGIINVSGCHVDFSFGWPAPYYFKIYDEWSNLDYGLKKGGY